MLTINGEIVNYSDFNVNIDLTKEYSLVFRVNDID
jgi:hypothetical protein